MGAWAQVKEVIARRLGSMSGVNGLIAAWATVGLVQTAWRVLETVAPVAVVATAVEYPCHGRCESSPSGCVACPAAREATGAPTTGFSWWTALALICLELVLVSVSCAVCVTRRLCCRVASAPVGLGSPGLGDSRLDRVSSRASRRQLVQSESSTSSARGPLAHLAVDASEL